MKTKFLFGLIISIFFFCSATMVRASLITTTTSGDLIFQFLSSEAGGSIMEFGLGTPSTSSDISDRDVIFTINTFTNTISPNNIVNMGYYYSGSELDFYSNCSWSDPIKWAFSGNLDSTPTNEDLVVFTDIDNSKPWGGRIVQSIGADTWILYLDSAWSYGVDDDDNEMVIKVWVDPSATPPMPVPEPATIVFFSIGLLVLAEINRKRALADGR